MVIGTCLETCKQEKKGTKNLTVGHYLSITNFLWIHPFSWHISDAQHWSLLYMATFPMSIGWKAAGDKLLVKVKSVSGKKLNLELAGCCS